MKGVFVILDGVADEKCEALGGLTPLSAAKTPNLDFIAGKSKLDYCYTVKEGVVPQSSSAVVSLLGYDPNTAPRGALEAQGAGVHLKRGDLALRTNFATVDDIENRNLLDRRAGRTLTTEEAKVLAKAINENVKLAHKFEFYPTIQHRGVLVFRGGFSDNITPIDPDYRNGVALPGSDAKVPFSKPMDDEDDSKFASDMLNSFVKQSFEILDKHPLNQARIRKGLYSANFLLARDPGNEMVKFKKLKGKWMGLSYMPLEAGIAEAAKMDHFEFKYPAMKHIDVYGNLYSGLKKAVRNSITMIKRKAKHYDYFYVHFKETDIPGHDNKPLDKVKMIEFIDKKFFSYLRKHVEKNPDLKILVTSDHTTSCRQKSHTEHPVPVLFYSKDIVKEEPRRFTEEEGLAGKKILGRKLLEKTLLS